MLGTDSSAGEFAANGYRTRNSQPGDRRSTRAEIPRLTTNIAGEPMSKRSTLISRAVQALCLTHIVVAGSAYADTPPTKRPVTFVDQGTVNPGSPMSAAILVNNFNDTAFDAAVASLYDVSSPNFHNWMSDAEIASRAPTSQNISVLQSSLRAQGFAVAATDDPGVLRIAGTAAQFQTAFG